MESRPSNKWQAQVNLCWDWEKEMGQMTYTLTIPTTIGDISHHRANIMRPDCPLELHGSARGQGCGDIRIDSILVADDIGISV